MRRPVEFPRRDRRRSRGSEDDETADRGFGRIRIVGSLDEATIWSTGRGFAAGDLRRPGGSPPSDLRGVFATAESDDSGRWRLTRDALGIGKLFWCSGDDGTLLVASRPRRLIDAGCPFGEIRALPPGAAFDIDPRRRTVERLELGRGRLDGPGVAGCRSVDEVASEVRSVLDRFFSDLAGSARGSGIFVCLSGGLDSTGIAVLAREHFRDVVAVSFDLERPDGAGSADRRAARRVARDLGLPLMEVTVSAEGVLSLLDTVLVECIDWRDFNVHAGLVNAALAGAIHEERGGDRGDGGPLVLTGDLVNELLVDYEAETYRGRTYYRLPRLPLAAVRRFLVRGLATSHREVGVFGAWGLRTVLPYAVAADAYLALDADSLADPERKSRLARRVFGGAIPSYVYRRPKTRAQVGDPDTSRGVLALCSDRGVDREWLVRRFCRLHETDPTSLGRFIRAGRYRAGQPDPATTGRSSGPGEPQGHRSASGVRVP